MKMTIPPSHHAPRNPSRNYYAFFGDYIGFSLAMAFASSTTVLPDLVGRLTSSELAVGLLATVTNGAWLLPQLVYANWLTNKRRKKPFYMLASIIGRPLYLLYAIALALGLHRQPVLALLVLYGVQALFFGTDALATVAWFDVLGKAIPEARRGRLIGRAQLIGGLASAGAGVLIAFLFGANGLPYPQNYAAVLGISSLCLLLSMASWSFVVEPDEPVEEHRPRWRDYIVQLSDILHRDRAFARLILVRLLAGLDGLATSFYIIFATRELGLPSTAVGLFTTAQIVGKILASVGLGALAERTGSHRVVQVATAVGLTAPLASLALLLTGVQESLATGAVFAWVFAAMGTTISAGMLGYMNYVMALAPTGQRPAYIGLFNTISGVLIVVPTLGGWLLQTTSYTLLFALTAGMLTLGHILSWSLPAALQAPAPPEAGREGVQP
jgi:MFS family permease